MEISFKKYLLTAAIGFGIGGVIWGWFLFKNIDNLNTIFDLKIAILFSLIGGVFLVLFYKNTKQVIRLALLGTIGWIIGFIVGYKTSYLLFVWGTAFIQVIFKQNLSGFLFGPISNFWLVFLLIGSVVGFFYGLTFGKRIWPIVWRSGVGFGLGSLIGPAIGNLIGNLFGLPLINYLITFLVIGIIPGLFLAWGIHKNIKY